MKGNKALILLTAFLFLANFANAATIYGAVYDLSLAKVGDARVEINSVPRQFMVAQNGTYSFNVPNGAYTIKAQQVQKGTIIASVQENVTIRQSGSYVLDLILFPDIEEGVEDVDIDINEVERLNGNAFAVAAIIVAFLIAALAYFAYRKIKQKKELPNGEEEEHKQESIIEGKEIDKITELLKKGGGRLTQKEIRKEIPLSEAKISLMIAELEHKGVVEKIKKGRGNIIILKRQP